ncbi:MAG: FAD-dependent oxidoreductase [Pseudomonadota bacterium]
MKDNDPSLLDVAVIGGGPAGISACLKLSESSGLKTALFESEPELGGVPRSCHIYFGMRDRGRIHRGPAYARELDRLVRQSSTRIYTGTTVLRIRPGKSGAYHQIDTVSLKGLRSYRSQCILLSTGCYETPRGTLGIPGARPAGIFTTGALQQMVNLHHQRPGHRAVIIGSEAIALSSLLTLKRAGVSIAGMVEEREKLQTFAIFVQAMSLVKCFPVYRGTSVKSILGRKRVEGVELYQKRGKGTFRLACDTVILTGKFRPDSKLIDDTPILRDPSTLGPLVDMDLMTPVPGIFAAGNVLRGADMHDLCALEGKKAAQTILKRLTLGQADQRKGVTICAEAPVRYVVPQRILPEQIRARPFTWRYPGYSLQVEKTLLRPTLEAWSGNERIWERTFLKIIGNYRLPLPVHRFDWNRVDPGKGITLRLRHPIEHRSTLNGR